MDLQKEYGLEIYNHIFADKHLTVDKYTGELIQAKFYPEFYYGTIFPKNIQWTKVTPRGYNVIET